MKSFSKSIPPSLPRLVTREEFLRAYLNMNSPSMVYQPYLDEVQIIPYQDRAPKVQ